MGKIISFNFCCQGRGCTVKLCSAPQPCRGSPCPAGCSGAGELPAWHPRSPSNAGALPRLHEQLGKVFAQATRNKVGSVPEPWPSPGLGGRKPWWGSTEVPTGNQSPGCSDQTKRQKVLLGLAGQPQGSAWHSVPGRDLLLAPKGRGWERRGQGLTSAQQCRCRGHDIGG